MLTLSVVLLTESLSSREKQTMTSLITREGEKVDAAWQGYSLSRSSASVLASGGYTEKPRIAEHTTDNHKERVTWEETGTEARSPLLASRDG